MVREPRPIRGARAPLFDRLSAPGAAGGEGSHSGRVLDYPELRESVRAGLRQLLNTRSSIRNGQAAPVAGTVLGYGVPDFASLSPGSEADRHRLENTLAERIAAHEPRLSGIQVILSPAPGNPGALAGTITATLQAGLVSEPVSFELAVDRLAGQPEADGAVSID